MFLLKPATAKGDIEADLLINNAKVINVLSGEIHIESIGVYDSRFIGFGDYDAKEIIDAQGLYMSPDFIDGHAPGITGKDLNAYIFSNIDSDHESTSAKEAMEKGHIDHSLKKAISLGMDTVTAYQMTTINTSNHYRLKNVGAIKPRFWAAFVESDTSRDILKIMVLERHKAAGRIGKAFVRGFGLKSRAIGSTVAHDAHNIMIVGTNDADMFTAFQRIKKLQGGLVVIANNQVTDMGLIDVEKFEITSLFADER